MKDWFAKQGILSSASTLGADLSYLLAVVFTSLFVASWFLAKKKEGTRHHNLILASMVAMVIYFTVYYMFRQLGVLALEGKEGFGGPEEIYKNVFVPILTTHLVLVTVGLILAFYMIVIGFRSSEKIGEIYVLKEGELKMTPKTFRGIMLALTGIWGANQCVLTFVRHASWQSSLAWAIIFAAFAGMVGLEKAIENWVPDGAKRHRILGRGTMVIYVLILLTSTATYLMLYIIYPPHPAALDI